MGRKPKQSGARRWQSPAEGSLSLIPQGAPPCESLSRVIPAHTRELGFHASPPSIINQELPAGDLNSQALLALC